MKYTLFTLHPALFDSFTSEALIARALAQNIIDIELVNWRENYGIGGYKQVDDRPYGGGTGMVLQAEPLFNALFDYNAVSTLFREGGNHSITTTQDHVSDSMLQSESVEHTRIYPRNDAFFEMWSTRKHSSSPLRSVTISMSPRGYQFNQRIAEWLSTEFDTINLVCGRYEGFDARANELFDLELSMGPYVTNGGEIPAMVLIEAVSRLLPDFVTKNPSVMHDSFSSSLNVYQEMSEFVHGQKNQSKQVTKNSTQASSYQDNIFDKVQYMNTIAPYIEHNQYTRPAEWKGYAVPAVLLQGDHKKIQSWRTSHTAL